MNWQGFSIANNESVRFIQQYAESSVLNRVIGQDPSRILGLLQSNGRVFLINPNGILFGQGARIDVNGLFASTLAISNQDFLAGKFNFSAGAVAGSIQNQGTITTPEGGKIFLIAPDIENSGIINSPKGDVLLAAGHSVQLVDSLDPDISVVVSAPENKAVNLGQIVAQSGKVGIYGGLISQKGIVNADSAVMEGGRIFLKATKAIELSDTSVIGADGTKGGQIIVKTEENGQISGTLTARGTISAQGDGTVGSGGFVETSAKIADINSVRVNTRGGTWLLDPDDVEIHSTGTISGATLVTPGTIQNALVDNNFVVQTNAEGTGGNGDIFVNDAVSWDSAYSLTLSAIRDININQVISSTGGGNLTLRADSDADGAGNVIFGGNGQVNMPGGGAASIYYNPPDGYGSPTDYSGYFTGVTPTAYMLVNDVGQESGVTPGLQAMNTNLAGTYALGKDIDASATSTWNNGAGFVPVGSDEIRFTGAFDGLGHTITGLDINRPTTNYVGLFGYNSGVVRNVGLVSGNITGKLSVGGLVGFNWGAITNSYSTGAVTGGGVEGGAYAGGLVGYNNYGSISNSYSTGGAVSGTMSVGGLVGWSGNGSISNSYSTGAVSGTTYVGGLVGSGGGTTISSSYWDTETSGRATSTGGAGRTTVDMMTLGTFAGWIIADSGGSSAVWRIYDGNTYPLLRSFLIPLTITADNVAKTYDGTPYVSALTNPIYSIPDAGSSELLFNTDNAYNSAVNAGSYTPKLYSTQQGYDIGYVNGLLTINPAEISTTTIDLSGSRVYDGTIDVLAGIFTLGGLIDGQTLTLTGVGTVADKNVGLNKPVTLGTLTLGDGDGENGGLAGNYTLDGGTHKATITAFPLTVTAVKNTKAYDGNTSAAASPTITAGSLAVGDTATLSEVYDSKLAGTGKTLTPAAVISDGNGGNNYLVTYVKSTTGVIDPGQTISGMLDVAAAGKTIDFAVNGALLPDQALTDASGNYSSMFPLNSIPNNSALLVYVADDSSVKSASVYLATGGDITNLLLASNTVTAGGGTMSNATFGIAKGELSSGDIPYSVLGTDLTLSPNFNFQTASGTTYSIDGNTNITTTGTGNIIFGGPVTGTGSNLSATAGGNITLNGLATAGTGAGTGSITLNSGGAIINGMGNATSISAASLFAEAVSGIGSGAPLVTGVSQLTALNTSTNNIEIDNTGILAVSGLINLGTGDVLLENTGAITTDTSTVTSSGGIVSIIARSPLTIGTGGVSASGSISLAASPSGGSDNLTINGPIASSNGSIILSAGSSLVLGPGGSFSAPNGTTTLNGAPVAGNAAVIGNQTATGNTVSSLITAMGTIESTAKDDDDNELEKKTTEGGEQTTDDKRTDDDVKKYCN